MIISHRSFFLFFVNIHHHGIEPLSMNKHVYVNLYVHRYHVRDITMTNMIDSE